MISERSKRRQIISLLFILNNKNNNNNDNNSNNNNNNYNDNDNDNDNKITISSNEYSNRIRLSTRIRWYSDSFKYPGLLCSKMYFRARAIKCAMVAANMLYSHCIIN